MEAKDTVMNEEERKRFYPWLNEYKEELDAYLYVQAEISFKAGIKEVVDFLTEHNCGLDSCDMEYQIWQAQLKEWGL